MKDQGLLEGSRIRDPRSAENISYKLPVRDSEHWAYVPIFAYWLAIEQLLSIRDSNAQGTKINLWWFRQRIPPLISLPRSLFLDVTQRSFNSLRSKRFQSSYCAKVRAETLATQATLVANMSITFFSESQEFPVIDTQWWHSPKYIKGT